jgi:hypothetical protein
MRHMGLLQKLLHNGYKDVGKFLLISPERICLALCCAGENVREKTARPSAEDRPKIHGRG